MSDAKVPLPEALSTCGCPNAPGMHKTTCVPAIKYDSTPLKDRPGYVWDEATQRSNTFAGFGWDYPHHISGDGVDIWLDIDQIIFTKRDDYLAYEMEDVGYQEWEKPWVFIHDQVMEQLEGAFGGVDFGRERWLCSDRSTGPDELRLHPRWTPEDTERLEGVLGTWVDPNQGVLDV